MKCTAIMAAALGCVFGPVLPASAADIAVVGGLTREVVAQPGDQIEGKVIITNSVTEPRYVRVYQTDYSFTADGRSEYGEPGSLPRSNARWITVSPDRLEVPPEGDASVYYTIRVPNGGDLVGSYWSMLMVELLPADSPELVAPDGSEDKPLIAVRTVMRYGIQMVTDIGNTGTRAVEFADKRLVKDDAQCALEVDIKNVGERRLTPAVWADLRDAEGLSVGRFEGLRLRVYPECSARFHINLAGVPAGSYNALIVVDNGDENVFGTQAKLEIQ